MLLTLAAGFRHSRARSETLNPAIPNNMKHLFSPSRAFASLRIVVAGACVLTAAALAFVATANNNSSGPDSKNRVMASSLVKDSITGSASELGDDDSKADPSAAAAEDYAQRAYPADELDLGALINAQAGMQNFLAHATPTPAPTATPGPTDTPAPTATPTATATPKKKKGGKRGKGTPTPTPTPVVTTTVDDRPSPPEPPQLPIWQQVGDGSAFTATDPNSLTFTGSTQRVSGRVSAMAIDSASGCSAAFCRLWVGAAGGGIWRTTNALATVPTWTYISGDLGGFFTNAIGAITYDNANGVLYVGTGEPNASGDSEAGLGIFKSIDGGNTWTFLNAQIGPITTISPGTGANGTYTGNAFLGRSISSIVIDPTNANIMYVSSARGIRGVSSVAGTGATTSNPPTPRPPFGLFKSTDGGGHFTFIFDGDPSCGPGTCLGGGALSSLRGMTETELDPNNHNIVYTAAFTAPSGSTASGGIWRSTDAGATWVQILPPVTPTDGADRCSFDVTSLGSPVTRMYAGCGNAGTATASFFRSNNAQGAATFTNLTATEIVPFTANYCTGQCWYDQFVFTPPGFPNTVYLGGSFTYGECGGNSDCRVVVMTQDGQDAGPIWNDMTWDAQNNGMPPSSLAPPQFFGNCCNPNQFPVVGPAPNGIHPDEHALVVNPANPLQFFEGSDGGVVRSNGTLTDISSQCFGVRTTDGNIVGPGGLFQCAVLLGFFGGGVPTSIDTAMNQTLDTLQFQSIRVAANNVNHLQGGTQDNGTWDEINGSSAWNQVRRRKTSFVV